MNCHQWSLTNLSATPTTIYLALHMHPTDRDKLVPMAHATNVMRLGMDSFSSLVLQQFELTLGSMPHPHSSSRSDVAVSNFPA